MNRIRSAFSATRCTSALLPRFFRSTLDGGVQVSEKGALSTGIGRTVSFSSKSREESVPEQVEVFDRALKERQRSKSIILTDWMERQCKKSGEEYLGYDYLRSEAADRLVDRLNDITRKFPEVLELGSHKGHVLRSIIAKSTDASIDEEGSDGQTDTDTGAPPACIGGVKSILQTDTSEVALYHARKLGEEQSLVTSYSMAVDEENLPFAPESFDLVLSNLSLHWVNDLPSTLMQIRECLRPDGCFIAAMFGANTLQELRYSIYLAEQERKGGFTPHTSPFAKTADITGLLQDAGFTLPTVDVDNVQVSYPDMFTLMEHLQYMGENNASIKRQFSVGKDTFLSAAAIYQQLYGLEDGSIPATFQLTYMIGWCPHESQPKPKKRGSAKKSLKEISTISYSGDK